jgi:hypothetical protein
MHPIHRASHPLRGVVLLGLLAACGDSGSDSLGPGVDRISCPLSPRAET